MYYEFANPFFFFLQNTSVFHWCKCRMASGEIHPDVRSVAIVGRYRDSFSYQNQSICGEHVIHVPASNKLHVCTHQYYQFRVADALHFKECAFRLLSHDYTMAASFQYQCH